MGAIEDIILNQGKWTGISGVRLQMSDTFVEDAARFMVLDHPGHAFILTGFFVPIPHRFPPPETGSAESDGPPGAYFLGRALTRLGWKVTYVVDRYAAFTLEGQPTVEEVIDFPIADDGTSEQFAIDLLERHKPSVLVAVERPGASAEGKYQYVGGADVTERTAKLDYLFNHHTATIGIGDWGNEIGLAKPRRVHRPAPAQQSAHHHTVRASHHCRRVQLGRIRPYCCHFQGGAAQPPSPPGHGVRPYPAPCRRRHG